MPAADPAQQARDQLRMTKHIVDNCECRNAGQWATAVQELDALAARLQAAEEALREADRLVSVVHDAIWHPSVKGAGNTGIDVLHSNDRPDSAQSAIWRLHEILRDPAYFAAAQPDSDTDGAA